MKIPHTIFVVLLCTFFSATAQYSIMPEVITGQNISAFQFRFYEYDEVSFGFNSRIGSSWHQQTLRIDSLSRQDSNAYSHASFNIGSIATQNIYFGLIRPISLHGCLVVSIYRESNPGWVSRSFLRNTDMDVVYNQSIGERIETDYRVGMNVLDREQNGGVNDSVFYNLEANGLNELNIIGNTYLSDAYNRSFHAYAASGLDYLIIERTRIIMKVGVDGGWDHHKFRYYDGLVDTSYYNNFSSLNTGVINDSFRINELYINPKAKFYLFDSAKSSSFQADLGIKQSWYGLLNNERTSSPMNQVFQLRLGYVDKRLALRGNIDYFNQGYNVGDVRFETAINLNLISKDSNHNNLQIVGKQLFQRGRPSMIFERYNSSIALINEDLNKVMQQSYVLGMESRLGIFRIGLNAGYRKLDGFVYFDQNADVFQKQNSIEIYTVQGKLGISKDWFEINCTGGYQWNERSRYYSLPEWINTNQGLIKWNMFSSRLRMKGGLQSQFYSRYYSRGYLPFYDSYYVQSFHRFEDYFQVDALLYTRIKTVTVGVNAFNILYGIFDTNPIIAPNMVAVPRYFSLHFAWDFKN